MEQVWYTAAAWIGLALLASLISIRIGISVALVEIFLGFVAGNCGAYFGTALFQPNAWINFLAGFASVVLTFLAGAEIEPESFRRQLVPTLAIGLVSFLFPFLGAMAYAYYVSGWNLQAAQIAGIALSTTSMAVVYAVMVETGLNATELGKLILAACFITDLGTVLALGLIFAHYDYWLVVFVVVTAVVLWRHAGYEPAGLCLVGRPGQRTGDQIHFPGALRLGSPGGDRPQRSGAAGLSLRHGGGGAVCPGQGPHPPHAGHRLCLADPLLLHQGRHPGLPAGVDCRVSACWWSCSG